MSVLDAHQMDGGCGSRGLNIEGTKDEVKRPDGSCWCFYLADNAKILVDFSDHDDTHRTREYMGGEQWASCILWGATCQHTGNEVMMIMIKMRNEDDGGG